MVGETDVRFTAEQALDVIDRDVPGVLVECGVWRGGCSAAMLLGQRERYGEIRRRVLLLDSFEGLPPATDRDGPLARQWQADSNNPGYHDNCTANLDDVRNSFQALGVPTQSWEIIPGWFDQTVPALADRLHESGIALLRLDGDWYDSTIICLEHLAPLVSEEGVILVDDYYAWDGCARAVHDYLSSNDLAWRLRQIPEGIGAYMVKRAGRKSLDSL